MSKKKKWTSEEDQILVQAIKANPHNLAKVFRDLSTQLERTETALEMRWYYHLKRTSNCFITISNAKTLKNGKTIPSNCKDNSEKTNKTLWQKIKALLKW